ncbi:VOC family protein [Salimicrobium halophilum]|uniref:Glyoxalase-like domain-containing protein n=1 Tax=Salimicrobium halophilum TaxID=86666 RepID=A0A1G8VQL0_9BACI|nr:VOC family protein [Salimicrobium halophilum]SDJ68326.1 Glyoxalase-like domain-containing protein [Salimicrobium halophilum]
MLAIDHIVVTTTEPEQDRFQFTSHYGLKGTAGGEHPEWGTHNELCFFDNRFYIEWLGVTDASKAEGSGNPLIRQMMQQQTGETIQIALRTGAMDDFITYYEESGIEYEGPFPGARRRTDGSLLEWRMLFPRHEEVGLPFLIEWKGDNFPTDPVYINPLSSTMVEYGTNKDRKDASRIFRNIFRFSDEDSPGFPLSNGRLYVTEEKHITTYLDHMTL